jgi:hypothetical protein
MKVCSRCGEEKPLTEFYARQGRCKPCRAAINREAYAANPRPKLEKNKRWHEANHDRRLEHGREWYARNAESQRKRTLDRAKETPEVYAEYAAKRRADERKATPPWADRQAIAAVYREARKRREAGEDVHVDHVVPLTSELVCGLHVEHNLEIIPAFDNRSKKNRHWPDMP